MPPMKQITSQDRVTQTIQSNAAQAISGIEASVFQNGNLVTAVALASGQDNLVAHGLSRVPQIWVLCNLDTNSIIWSPSASALGGNWNNKYINLQCSASCTVAIWVA